MNTTNNAIHQSVHDLAKLELVFEAANEGFFYMTSDGTTKFFNKSFYAAFDIDLSNNNFEKWLTVVHPDDRQILINKVHHQFDSGEDAVISEYRVINRNGEVMWLEALGKLIDADENNDVAMVGYHADITQRKIKEEEIKQLAFYDPLTRLYNRNFMNIRVEELMSQNQQGFLIQISMNNLKKVNSAFNYAVGDDYICMVADRIRSCLGETSVLARNYLDEFFLLLSDSSISTFNEVVKTIEDALSKPYLIRDRVILVKPLICVYPIIGFGDSAEDVFHQAEHVISYMKMKRQYGVLCYDSKIDDFYTRQLKIEEHLHWAISRNEVFLNFQPVVETSTGRITGFEALLRWNNAELGMVGPDEFIPIAERAFAINALGEFVLKKACEFAAKLDTLNFPCTVAVNISLVELSQDDYVERTVSIIRASGIDFSRLAFEVTESITLDEDPIFVERLKQLHSYGIRLAIDDFGTGYSSMKSILSLPISFIKIDKSIVQELLNNKEALSMIKMLTLYSHEVDYKVIAEGVETQAMREMLTELKVDRSQGYLFSRPISEEEALKLIK